MTEIENFYLYEIELLDEQIDESESKWLDFPTQNMEDSKIWEDENVEIKIVWW